MRQTDFEAAQAFLLGAKNFWTTSMFSELHDIYEGKAARESTEKAVEEIQEDTTYRYFVWLERHLQRMKYTGRYGLVPYYKERTNELLAPDEDSDDRHAPRLQPEMSLPKYYKSLDVHQHKGGLWSEDTAGFAYEYGARTTTILLGDSHEDLHSRFTNIVASPDDERILDMGCGFGKSTRPFLNCRPGVRVDAVDLSAPCLRVAANFSRQQQTTNVCYSQQDARHTDFDDESFDLVTSTMLLHEMPVKSLIELFDECFRVLKPGGTMAHLDFYILPDDLTKLLHYGHAKRNNEIFMPGFAEMDLPDVLQKAGFETLTIERFKEAPNVDLDSKETWRFPWTTIIAKKPARIASSC